MLKQPVRLWLVLMALFLVFGTVSAAAQTARTFYIDWVSGSDSNSATARTAPWKRHPYMIGFTGSYSHVAGDRFIFKGGVSWPASCFQMVIESGGTSAARDYYGVDRTWFTGAAWSRPKFDLNFQVPTGNMVIKGGSGSGFEDFDNLEIVHQGIGVQAGAFAIQQAYNFYNGDNGVVIKNNYIHDWVAVGNLSGDNVEYSAGSIYGGVTLDSTVISDAAGYQGSGKTPVRFGGACQNCDEVKFSTFHDVMAGCFSVGSCHDNEFYNMTGEAQSYTNLHSQIIEDDSDKGGNPVYNNYIHDSDGIGVTIYVCPPVYAYNNVIANTNNVNIMVSGVCGAPSQPSFVENNTVDCSNGTACFGTDSKGTLSGTLNLRNNHWITNGSPTSLPSSISNLVQSNNITQSPATATVQGYTQANKYAPTSATGATVGTGANLSGVCSGDLLSLCKDKLLVPRPQSGAWDVGTYQFDSAAAATRPEPPTNLTGIVH